MVIRIFILAIIMLVAWGNIVLAAVPPKIEAEAAVLMVLGDNGDNLVLYGKNSTRRMYPASTTKIITLITALEKGNLNGIVTTSPRSAACEGSSLELKAGDKLILREALYGMMLTSGNDAAEAIAETVAGSVPDFVAMMNEEARKMGATLTHFANPHGLPDVEHFSTAYDLALFTAYGMKNPTFAKIVSTREYDVNFLKRRKVHLVNTNKLLGSYAGANGVKTGFTNAAGDCLVAAAKRGNVQLIAVILNDDNRWEDAAKLFDYGFTQMALDDSTK
jgi:D-alanyl-D-alanine carboxypeptidase (penicillin-binding protein 5/6)